MSIKSNGYKMAALLVAGILLSGLLSGCRSISLTTPVPTPTNGAPSSAIIQTTPLGDDLDFAQLSTQGAQISETQTAIGGMPTTPQPVVVTGTLVTPQTVNGTPGDIIPGATTVVAATVPAVNTPSGPVPTAGPKPASYTLQAGEFPYCIARRFNVNPDELLSLNGISDGRLFMPGLVLKIPQTGNPFPADRALVAHPATYTVSSASETVYSIACQYGDVDPAAIASQNGISVSAKLTVGQKLNIP